MTDPFDIDLQDAELQEEIGLMAELMAVATAAREPLSQARIDELLGTPRSRPEEHREHHEHHEHRATRSMHLVAAGTPCRIPGATQGQDRPGRRPADVRSVPRPRDPGA